MTLATPYLGLAGSLQALKAPARGVEVSARIPGGVQRLLGGGAVRQRIGQPKRTFVLRYPWLNTDELGLLEAFAQGAMGPGPFVFLDPSRRNQLSANQSSGTDALRDPSGFLATGFTGHSVSSSTTVANRGSRSLLWATGTATGTGRGVILDGSTGTDTLPDLAVAVPVVTGLTYTASVGIRLGTGSIAVDVTIRIRWYDAAGAFISQTVSANYTPLVVGPPWPVLSVSSAAPAGAAYGVVSVRNATTTLSSASVYLDSLQLEQSASAGLWVPGTGVPRVSVDDLSDNYPLYDRHEVALSLVEV